MTTMNQTGQDKASARRAVTAGPAPLWRAMLASAILALGACTANGPAPQSTYEARMHADFQRDRDNCRQVAEQTTPYVNPKDSKAVGDRSYRVEGEIQKCMLARGWNNPRFDGWKAGRY